MEAIKKFFSSKDQTNFMLLAGAVLIMAVMLFTQDAHAGTGGTAFDTVWDTLKEWTTGTLGRVIAGAMVLVGIVAGVARQSLMAFAIGIGGGVGLYNAPTILESIVTATISAANQAAPSIMQLGNGLGM